MLQSLRVLLCGRDEEAIHNLGQHLHQAGVGYDWATTAHHARQWLSVNDYDAMTLDLMLRDQDGISLIHELRSSGRTIPILGVALRSRIERLPSATHGAMQLEWLDKAANQARALFATKIATKRMQGYRPNILFMDPDPYSSRLVTTTLLDCADVECVETMGEARTQSTRAHFDFALMNPIFASASERHTLLDFVSECPTLPLIMHTVQHIRDPAEKVSEEIHTLVDTIRTHAMMGCKQPLKAHA